MRPTVLQPLFLVVLALAVSVPKADAAPGKIARFRAALKANRKKAAERREFSRELRRSYKTIQKREGRRNVRQVRNSFGKIPFRLKLRTGLLLAGGSVGFSLVGGFLHSMATYGTASYTPETWMGTLMVTAASLVGGATSLFLGHYRYDDMRNRNLVRNYQTVRHFDAKLLPPKPAWLKVPGVD
jgi:hypothetical protein